MPYKIIREHQRQGEKKPNAFTRTSRIKIEVIYDQLALFRDGQWTIIPKEGEDFRDTGETYESAKAKGILFGVSPYICLICGETTMIPELRYKEPVGCRIMIRILLTNILMLIGGISLPHVIVSCLGMFFVLMIWAYGRDMLKRRKYSEILKATAKDSCDQCGSKDLRSAGKFGQKIALQNGMNIEVQFRKYDAYADHPP